MKAVCKWVLGLMLALACSHAGAATFIHLDNPERHFTTADGATQATTNYRGGVNVSLSGPAHNWTFMFAPRQGQPLIPGSYTGVDRFTGQVVRPGLDLFGDGGGCGILTGGRFDVLEIAYGPDGSVQRFAADFTAECNGPVIHGVVRFNSDLPQVLPTPIAFAGWPQSVNEGESVLLDGTASRDPGGSGLTYFWSQTGGPAVTLANPSSSLASFTAPNVALGGVDLTFELRVTNSAGASATATALVHVMDAADPHTFLLLDSDPGEYIGQGLIRRLTPREATFTPQFVSQFNSPPSVSLVVNDGTDTWRLNFAAPFGQTLAAGTYGPVERYPQQSNARPGLSVATTFRTCNVVTGTFIVHEISIVVGVVQRLAADFVQHCEGVPSALFGTIRYNSGVAFDPQAPFASAGPPQAVDEGANVTLDGSGSADPAGSPLTYAWSQVSGPAVTLSNASSPVPTFVAPQVAPGGADLLFELRVTNGAGRGATASVTVHVLDAADSRNVIYLDSDAGDFVGQGIDRHFGPLDGRFQAIANGRGGVSVLFDGGIGSFWGMHFGPPSGQPFAVGTYVQAERYGYGSSARPALEISNSGRSCNTLTGVFTVYEVAIVSGVVQKFAADFEQHCDAGAPALRGGVRFNSNVPYAPNAPIAYAGPAQDADEGATVTLDGSGSRDRAGGSLAFSWYQVAGPPVTLANASTATPSFTAPVVAPGGADLTFELRVTNSGGVSATSTVTVHIRDAADIRTFIYFDSDPGDYIGGGIRRSFTPLDGTLTANTNYRGGVSLAFTGGAYWWSLNFGPPSGQPFVAGTYANADAFWAGSPVRPGIDIYGTGRGCSRMTGVFTVYEVVVSAAGVVEKFSADFEQHCEGAPAALRGSIRFNSAVAQFPAAPNAYAGAAQDVGEGAAVSLDGSASRNPLGGSLAFLWTQVAGPPVTLANASSATPSFTAPAVGPGGADITFELRVTNGAALSATSRVTIHVRDATDPRTFIYFDSDTGDYIGGGVERTFTALDGGIGAATNFRGVTVRLDGGLNWWTLDFGAPTGMPLVPGTYVYAERFPFASPALPGLDISGSGRGCNTLTGQFTVLEVTIVNGTVQKFAADFEQHCEGGTAALYGGVRFNSGIPYIPKPSVLPGRAQTVAEGATVRLDGSASRDPSGGSITFQWTQLSGPTVVLSDPSSATPTFTAPAVPAGGAVLVFRLRVTDSAGVSATAEVSIQVRDAADPRTFIYFDSDPGDYIGGGMERTFTPSEGAFTAAPNSGGVTVQFNGGLSWWNLSFVAPTGQRFATGTYVFAERFASSAHPGMDISGSGRGCNTQAGQFTVLEVVIENGIVQKFAADFEQHCEGGSTALFGAVRFNSALPYIPKPSVSPGRPQIVDEGAVVRLDGSASRDPTGGPVVLAWTQVSGPPVVLSDPSSPTPTFTAPAVPPGGADLVFRLRVTDAAGVSATADVSIHIADAADPRTLIFFDSDSGDYIGGGLQRRFTEQDGTFSAAGNYRNGVTISFSGGGLSWWTLDFGPPVGQAFVPGTYLLAERYPFAQNSRPALSVSGSGRGCNTLTGEFTVLEVAFRTDGSVQRFAADFVQHCEGGLPALRGSVRFNSALPPQLLSARVVLTSNVGTSAFGAPVTLTVAVTGNGQTPTGTVAFRMGSTVIPTCSAVPLSGPIATCMTSSLPPGARNMSATYSGDAVYAAAASAAVNLTVTALAAPSGTNWALASNGGVASASSTPSSAFDASAVINGVRSGAGWGSAGGGWRDNTLNAFPDWVEIRFAGTKEISQVVVYGLQDAVGGGIEPADDMIAGSFALRDFAVQGWNGTAWVDLGVVTGNFLVKRPVAFAPFATDRIRVNVTNALGSVARIIEIEAYGAAVVVPGAPEPPSGRNVALAANGGIAAASSSGAGNFPIASLNDGVRTGAGWGAGGGWKDATVGAFPDWVQVNFAGARTIDRVVVYSLQDAVGSGIEPTDAMTFASFGVTAFTVEAWSGSVWVPVGSVSGNDLVKRTVTFAPTTTDRIRVNITAALGGVSRLVEVEAWEPVAGGGGGGGGGGTPTRSNVALASAGGVATASSTGGAAGAFPASAVNDGDVRGLNWGAGGGWKDATVGFYPDWVQVDFNGMKTIDEVVVYSIQDAPGAPVAPTDAMTFTSYGLLAFTVEGWNGSSWTPLGTVTNNNLVKRRVTFGAFTTSRIRVNITSAAGGVSRMAELEAWGAAASGTEPTWPPPIASAVNPVQFVWENDTVTLDGSASTDPSGFALTYLWTQTSGPAVTLLNPASARPSFTAPQVTPAGVDVTFELRVASTAGLSAPVTFTVHVQNPPPAPQPPSGRNVALAANGGVASASSVGAGNFPVASVIDGFRSGVGWGAGGGWKDATLNTFPDWVQIDFAGPRTIDRVVVYSLQDAAAGGTEPTDAMTFTSFGITAFTVEAWDGSAWVSVGSVSGNNLVKRTVTFAQLTTDRVRVNITGALAGLSRVVEIEAWEPGGGGGASPPPRSNVALSSTGAVASASSTGGAAGAFPASAVNNGDVRGLNWAAGGGWKDATVGAYPDWVQIDFNGTKTIDEVIVYSIQDAPGAPVAPTDGMTFSSYGLLAFTVEGWNGSSWTVLGTVTGNNLVKRSVTFSPFATSKIRVNITEAAGGVSRMAELEAWGN